jgi:uncharacterized protein (TIGR02145 family)
MLRFLFPFLLLPLLVQAQLKEFEVGEMPRPDVAVVQANIQFPEDACIFIYSSIRGLNFRSSLDAIDKVNFNAVANRYEILVKPLRQMVFVYHSDFMEKKIETINPNPKDVLYYKVEDKRQEVVSTEPGTLKITTEPSGADIFINGIKTADKTPFTGELPGATYRIKLQKAMHETLDTLIAVRSGQTTVLSVRLTVLSTQNETTKCIDPAGREYRTVQIGDQLWMAENLAYKPPKGKYWAYDNDQKNVVTYGYLYDWETAKEACPAGWHLPTDAEWTSLTDYLGGAEVAGEKIKSRIGWADNGNGTNESGFFGLPGGNCWDSVDQTVYIGVGVCGYWWSSTEVDSNLAWNRPVCSHGPDGSLGSVLKKRTGHSVRCLKD